MSFIHASPDELLPQAPELQKSSCDVQAASAGAPRQRHPFNLRKITRIGSIVLFTLMLAGSLIALIVMGSVISDLNIRVNTLDAAFRSGQIGQLTTTVSTMEERIKTLEMEAAALTKLHATIQTVSDEQATLRNSMHQLQEAVNGSSQDAAQLQARLKVLENDAQKTSTALTDLSRQQAQKPVEAGKPGAGSSAAKARSAVAAKKINRSARQVVMQKAPFVLTGIEHRGGQTFAVVIPRGATQISAMRLLSAGDAIQGWMLRSLDDSRSALFVINGREQRLHVE